MTQADYQEPLPAGDAAAAAVAAGRRISSVRRQKASITVEARPPSVRGALLEQKREARV